MQSTEMINDLMKDTQFALNPEGYALMCRGLDALIHQLTESDLNSSSHNNQPKIDRFLIDECIGIIDQKLSAQMDEILHHPDFQALESSWSGLKFLVDRTDFRENNRISLVNISKADLEEDFEDSSEITESGLYQLAYSSEYGQFGGEPYGALIGNYTFSPLAPDIKLLKNIAAVSAMAHSPFISACSASFLGIQNMSDLDQIKDMETLFEGPIYTAWRSFRASPDSRYIGLTLPKFLLRSPYDPENNPNKLFIYEENIQSHQDYLWGNAAFAFATRLTESFAQFRWCPNIVGPNNGGALGDLPLHYFKSLGQIEAKIPVEVMISDRKEYELAHSGFMPLVYRKQTDQAAFFSANSTQKPKYFGQSEAGKDSALNYKLGTQMPYMFIICRIAHYLKILQREQLGGWKEAKDLENALNQWLNQYVANQENAPADIRSQKPLKAADISVTPQADEPGWHKVNITVRPHFKYMGSDITLSLAGRLDL